MDIYISEENEILFKTPFDESLKNKVANLAILKSHISDLSVDPSYESGFYLPISLQWKDAVNNQNIDYCKYLHYHGERSFRFISSNNQIIGIRCKDNLRYWTNEERLYIKELVESVVDELNSYERQCP